MILGNTCTFRAAAATPDMSSKASHQGTKKPTIGEFSKLLEGVTFTIAGLVNPERTELRNMGLDMGALYRPSWGHDSTLLVCAFPNTPTCKQVQAAGGTIVGKEWVTECYNRKELVDIKPYLVHVGRPWRAGSNLNDYSEERGEGIDLPAPLSHSIQRTRSAENSANLTKQVNGEGLGKEDPALAIVKKSPASAEDVQQWALEDLGAMLTWLEEQDDKPQKDQLEGVAGQGLLVCLEDSLKSLQEHRGLSMVMDNWAFIPRAVKELQASCEEKNRGHCVNLDDIIAEAERFIVLYESKLKKLGLSVSVTVPLESTRSTIIKAESKIGSVERSGPQQPAGKEEEDVTRDDATEIISGDSIDAAGFDTDETEELDEEEVAQCQEKVLQKFNLLPGYARPG